MIKFTNETLDKIMYTLREELEKLNLNEILEFQVKSNDFRKWVDLSQILFCKILLPKINNDGFITYQYQKLDIKQSFHTIDVENKIEVKYGINSTFATIDKLEEPSFLHYYQQALKNVNINKRIRILNLGINSGDEFNVIQHYATNFKNLELVGIDYCPSAIEKAKDKFDQYKNIKLYTADIKELDNLNLGTFDLIITIGTLQSTSLNFKLIFQSLIQNQLKKDGAIILGFPNCRWIDKEMIYGAKAPNYSFNEMSILYNDVIFCKKYLQQKKFRVTITGKDYIFLTGTSIKKG